MLHWWGKYMSKDAKKKKSKENSPQSPHPLISPRERKGIIRSFWSRRRSILTSGKRSSSRPVSSSPSPSPSSQFARCQSFNHTIHSPQESQPLPLPLMEPIARVHIRSASVVSSVPILEKRGKTALTLPIRQLLHSLSKSNVVDTATSSSDGDDHADSQSHSSPGNGLKNGSKIAAINTTSFLRKDQTSHMPQKTSRESVMSKNYGSSNPLPSNSPRHGGAINTRQADILNSRNCPFGSAPENSTSSPSRSPSRMVYHEKIPTPTFSAGKPYSEFNVHGCGQCSNPGLGQIVWQQNRCSPECSPISRSSQMTSPGPGYRIQSGSVTPIHPLSDCTTPESPEGQTYDKMKQDHPLPFTSIKDSNTCMFSSSINSNTCMFSSSINSNTCMFSSSINSNTCMLSSSINSPSIPFSPERPENPASLVSQWKKGKLIGRGTFGHVYAGFNSESGEMCAMKEVALFFDDAKSKECAKQLHQEISLLSRLQHPNIVRYYGCDMIDNKLYIYLEYVSGGSIHRLLQDYGPLGEKAIRNYTRQILSGLAYLHAQNTVHRDIKGANILVDPSSNVKLADFGMAKHITEQSDPLSFKGSPYWMAPEVITNTNGRNLAVDIWSLGCTMLEMITSKPPFSQYEGVSAMFKIGNTDELPPIPSNLSDDMKNFIMLCLKKDPSHRPTAAELLQHPLICTIEKPMQFAYGHDAYMTMSRSPNHLHMKESTFQGSQPVSPVNRDTLSSDTNCSNLPWGRQQVEDLCEPNDEQSVLAGRLSPHPVRDHMKLNISPNLLPVPSMLHKINDIRVRDDPTLLPEIIGFI